jgi:hypothetical protein
MGKNGWSSSGSFCLFGSLQHGCFRVARLLTRRLRVLKILGVGQVEAVSTLEITQLHIHFTIGGAITSLPSFKGWCRDTSLFFGGTRV